MGRWPVTLRTSYYGRRLRGSSTVTRPAQVRIGAALSSKSGSSRTISPFTPHTLVRATLTVAGEPTFAAQRSADPTTAVGPSAMGALPYDELQSCKASGESCAGSYLTYSPCASHDAVRALSSEVTSRGDGLVMRRAAALRRNLGPKCVFSFHSPSLAGTSRSLQLSPRLSSSRRRHDERGPEAAQ